MVQYLHFRILELPLTGWWLQPLAIVQLGCQHLAATPWRSSDCFGKGGKHPSSPPCPPLHGNHTARTAQRSLHELSGSEGPSHVSLPQTLLLSTSGQLFCWVVFGTLSYVVVLWLDCLSMFFITRYLFQSFHVSPYVVVSTCSYY